MLLLLGCCCCWAVVVVVVLLLYFIVMVLFCFVFSFSSCLSCFRQLPKHFLLYSFTRLHHYLQHTLPHSIIPHIPTQPPFSSFPSPIPPSIPLPPPSPLPTPFTPSHPLHPFPPPSPPPLFSTPSTPHLDDDEPPRVSRHSRKFLHNVLETRPARCVHHPAYVCFVCVCVCVCV